jgi:hypothetical protein
MTQSSLLPVVSGVMSGDLRGFMLNDMATTDDPRASYEEPEGKTY